MLQKSFARFALFSVVTALASTAAQARKAADEPLWTCRDQVADSTGYLQITRQEDGRLTARHWLYDSWLRKDVELATFQDVTFADHFDGVATYMPFEAFGAVNLATRQSFQLSIDGLTGAEHEQASFQFVSDGKVEAKTLICQRGDSV